MEVTKKPVLIVSVADRNNFPYAVSLFNSLDKFHGDEKGVDKLLITNETDKTKLASLPKNVILESLDLYTKDDPIFFYRQKPIIGEKYLEEYDLVIGLDSDSLVLGDLSYIWKTKDYDIATVLNANRFDMQYYPAVDISRIGILPLDYFNCGLVAMRNRKLVHDWKVWCFSPQFDRSQYKEQDGLNLVCYTGNWNVRCLDHQDSLGKSNAWFGLISKGEWSRTKLVGENIIVPKGEGSTPFPPVDTELKVVHMAGGSNGKKDNWGIYFPEDVYKRIEYLMGEKK